MGCSSDASDADAESATTTTEGPLVVSTAEPTDTASEATTILAIRVGAPSVAVDSLAAGEFGDIVVAGELENFEFDSKLVRPID